MKILLRRLIPIALRARLGSFEVSESRAASGLLHSGELRRFTIQPDAAKEVSRIVLESLEAGVAPIFVSVTVQEG
jgi:hypothetical protein